MTGEELELKMYDYLAPSEETFGTFTCPECGSHYFRTVNTKTMQRECKGHYREYDGYTECGFRFDEKDAHLYGLKKPDASYTT